MLQTSQPWWYASRQVVPRQIKQSQLAQTLHPGRERASQTTIGNDQRLHHSEPVNPMIRHVLVAEAQGKNKGGEVGALGKSGQCTRDVGEAIVRKCMTGQSLKPLEARQYLPGQSVPGQMDALQVLAGGPLRNPTMEGKQSEEKTDEAAWRSRYRFSHSKLGEMQQAKTGRRRERRRECIREPASSS